MGRTRDRLVLLVAVLAASGCGGPDDPDGPRGLDYRPEIVLPDPATITEAAVRDQLLAAKARLEEMRDSPGTASVDLAAAYGELGQLCQLYEFPHQAGLAYEQAVAFDPGEFRWAYGLAIVEAGQGRLSQAATLFERALATRPDYAPAWVRLGDARLELGETERAEQAFLRALEIDAGAVPAIAGLGRVAQARDDPAAAAKRFEEALARMPEADSLHYNLAMAYRALGRSDDAARHMALRGGVGPGIPDPVLDAVRARAAGRQAHIEQGIAAARAGRIDIAEGHFRRAVEEDSADAAARRHLGDALAALSRMDEALAEYREAARIAPGDPLVELRLGTAMALLGDDRAAVTHLEQALVGDPGSMRAHLALAKALQRGKDDLAAAEHYAIVVAADPGNVEARLGEALALVRAGRHAEAVARLERAIAAHADQPTFAHVLARVLAASPDVTVRDGPRALDLVERLARVQQNVDLAQTWAMALAAVGRFDEAVEVQRMALAGVRQAGRADLLGPIERNMARYESGRPCDEPWPADDPIFRPPAAGLVGESGS